jgi:CheY-like chemotaxis protein
MPSVLIVEDVPALAKLVVDLLTEEGNQVRTIPETNLSAVQHAVEQYEPDCVLLDGSGHLDYGEGWKTAAWLSQRTPSVPTIMLTAHHGSAEEARRGETLRSQEAGFVAILDKPFDLDDLLAAVGQAMRDDGDRV